MRSWIAVGSTRSSAFESRSCRNLLAAFQSIPVFSGIPAEDGGFNGPPRASRCRGSGPGAIVARIPVLSSVGVGRCDTRTDGGRARAALLALYHRGAFAGRGSSAPPAGEDQELSDGKPFGCVAGALKSFVRAYAVLVDLLTLQGHG